MGRTCRPTPSGGLLSDQISPLQVGRKRDAGVVPSDQLPDPAAAAPRVAERREQLQDRLRASGSFTLEQLAAARHSSLEETRLFVAQACARRQLFVIDDSGQAIIPAILLDETASPKPELAPAIAAFGAVGETSWSLWAWLATPSAWLGGEVPHELAKSDPERVTDAAHRAASNAA